MLPESVVVPIMTFLIGLLVGLLYKDMRFANSLTTLKVQIGTTNLSTLEAEVTNLKTTLLSMNLVELTANVKTMKESMLFSQSFQKDMTKIIVEHDKLTEQVEANRKKIFECKG
ncbi:MAG: hypothetical protein PHN44_01160 [Candidatus Marinimicrobia bacterium]|nr:hypothetical protein [Candidatus Neomarinimicrobiota bacterium]MDD5539098.1 hypothetical protein [Candidatus Neomarinimicrobiota bacterium]